MKKSSDVCHRKLSFTGNQISPHASNNSMELDRGDEDKQSKLSSKQKCSSAPWLECRSSEPTFRRHSQTWVE